MTDVYQVSKYCESDVNVNFEEVLEHPDIVHFKLYYP